MDFEKSGYRFSLLDDPLQKHVVAWESAMRSLNSDDPKEMLVEVSKILTGLKVTDRNADALFSVLQRISLLITDALKLLSQNETATLSANRGNIVKASARSGWITFPEYAEEQIDDLPPWVVKWMAEEIAGLYNRTQEIPNA